MWRVHSGDQLSVAAAVTRCGVLLSAHCDSPCARPPGKLDPSISSEAGGLETSKFFALSRCTAVPLTRLRSSARLFSCEQDCSAAMPLEPIRFPAISRCCNSCSGFCCTAFARATAPALPTSLSDRDSRVSVADASSVLARLAAARSRSELRSSVKSVRFGHTRAAPLLPASA